MVDHLYNDVDIKNFMWSFSDTRRRHQTVRQADKTRRINLKKKKKKRKE